MHEAWLSDSDFNDWLRFLAIDGTELLAMMRGYFDESEREDKQVMVVGGCLFLPEPLAAFRKEWGDLFGPFGGCHWAELAAQTKQRLQAGRFKDTRQAERNALMLSAMDIICNNVECWVATVCRAADVDDFAPTVAGYRKAYSVCCNKAVLKMGRLATTLGRVSNIAFFFESGHEHHEETDKVMRELALGKLVYAGTLRAKRRTKELAEKIAAVKYESHTFVQKGMCIHLEAADAVVWEVGKHNLDRKASDKRQTREPMLRLIEGTSGRFDAGDISRETMREYLAKIEATK